MFCIKKNLLFLILTLAFSKQTLADDQPANPDLMPGNGWQIGDTGLKVGGYANLDLDANRSSASKLGVGDFSLFLHWENDGKLRLFSEIDFEDAFSIQENKGVTDQDSYIGLERLYADYLYSEKANFRLGKFLTPIGRWNLIHAAPLVWTTNRPLITQQIFPTNATGAMVYGSLPAFGTSIDYSVYSALGNDWRPDPRLDPFEEALGLHLSVSTSKYGQYGVSYASFEQKGAIGERRNLLGVDYFWSQDRYEVSMEAVYRFSENGSQLDEKGLFIQGVMPLSERLYGIGRYELYDQAGATADTNILLMGLAFRMTPATVIKAEYSVANHNQVQAPEGFYASFAILF